VRTADVVITMCCGDVCSVYPGKPYLDWALADPAGHGIDEVRRIRDNINTQVRALLAERVGDLAVERARGRSPCGAPDG
jgi:arsenate reductase